MEEQNVISVIVGHLGGNWWELGRELAGTGGNWWELGRELGRVLAGAEALTGGNWDRTWRERGRELWREQAGIGLGTGGNWGGNLSGNWGGNGRELAGMGE